MDDKTERSLTTPLTPRQELFAQHYAANLNATQAYYAAGYKVANPNVAKVEGHRNLIRPNVAARIAELRKASAERIQIDTDWVVAEAIATYKHARELDMLGAAQSTLSLLAKYTGGFEQDGDGVSIANINVSVSKYEEKEVT